MADEKITPEEYSRWLTPRAALDALKPMPFNSASETIIANAKVGLLRAAARLISEAGSAGRPFQVMSSDHWKLLGRRELWNSSFWNNGNLSEVAESPLELRALGLTEDDVEPACQSLGVKFDPVGIAALKTNSLSFIDFGSFNRVDHLAPYRVPEDASVSRLPAQVSSPIVQDLPPLLEVPSPRSGKYANKVSKAEIKAWLEKYAIGRSGVGLHFKAILVAAKDAFRGRPVTEGITKAAIAELDMTLSPGNPSTLRNKRQN